MCECRAGIMPANIPHVNVRYKLSSLPNMLHLIGWYEASIWCYVPGPHSSLVEAFLTLAGSTCWSRASWCFRPLLLWVGPKWRSESGWIWAPNFWCKGRVGKSAEFPIPQSKQKLKKKSNKKLSIFQICKIQSWSDPWLSFKLNGVLWWGYTVHSVGSIFSSLLGMPNPNWSKCSKIRFRILSFMHLNPSHSQGRATRLSTRFFTCPSLHHSSLANARAKRKRSCH